LGRWHERFAGKNRRKAAVAPSPWLSRSEAEKVLGDPKKRSNAAYSNAPEIAIVYVSLGDTDQAMTWLEKGYEERFNPGVLLRPGFDPLRADSRFHNRLRHVGLPG
jgi:hypothetical protein